MKHAKPKMLYGKRYQRIDTKNLGEGGMGQTMLAKDLETNKIVVLKRAKGNQKWAIKEAQTLRKLDHPNIIKYLNSFQEGDEYIIVQEFADAMDLNKYMKEKHPNGLPEEEILKIFPQIMFGLQYCHSPAVRVLHRDIKAANIFLFRNGVVKLGDFGVSKELSLKNLTESFVGTPQFMSPELVNKRKYSFPTDKCC